MSSGDITVLGLQPGTCLLDDIGVDIPYGVSITIPGEKAGRSRDLWRCVSQRLLFQLHNGATLVQRSAPNPLTAEIEELRSRCRSLEDENQILRSTVAQLQAAQQGKLDAILGLLQSGVPVAMPMRSEAALAPLAAQGAATGVVEVEPPPFVPSQIRPDNVDAAHVQSETASSEGDVSTSARRLRELRRGQ